VLATPLVAQQAVPAAGVDRVIQQEDALVRAGDLLRLGRAEEAIALLRPLAATDPRATEMLFQVGLVTLGAAQGQGLSDATRTGLLDISIAAFRSILVEWPEAVRVRLELALALFLKGEDGLARREFRRALAGNPPPAVVANINRFLDQIRARRRWFAYGGVTLAPDSNIGAASDQREVTVNLFGQDFTFISDEAPPTSGVGVVVWGGWEYQHPLSAHTRLRFGTDLVRREYKGSRFDQMTLGTHIGPQFSISRNTQAGFFALARRHWQVSSPVYDELGLRFEGRHSPGPATLLTLNASWRDRNWRLRTDRDGPVASLSFGARYQVTPTLLLKASAFWERDRPDRKGLRTRSWGLGLGGSKDLPRGFTLGVDAFVNWTRYDEPGFPTRDAQGQYAFDSSRRKDRTTSVSVNLSKRDLTIGGLSPRLTVGRTARDSKALFQDYKRIYAELGFVRQF